MVKLWRSFFYWFMLPVRIAFWGCAFVFGHPISFAAGLAVMAALALFERQMALVAACAGIIGLLLMWISESPGAANTIWPSRSPFAEPLPKDF